MRSAIPRTAHRSTRGRLTAAAAACALLAAAALASAGAASASPPAPPATAPRCGRRCAVTSAAT